MKNHPAIMKKVAKLNIGNYKRHILICTETKCDPAGHGIEVWNYLKDRLKELGLSENEVFRSKVGCLRICCEGPIALVYPEGTWYGKVDIQRCEEIIQKHLIGGNPIEEYAFASNPLGIS